MSHPPPVGNNPSAPPQAFGIQGMPGFPDHGRPGPPPFYGAAGFPPPPPYNPYPNGGWDPYAYGQYGGYPSPMPPPGRNLRDEPPLAAGGGRRLGERIGGYAPGHETGSRADVAHNIEGLPPKPPPPVDGAASSRRNGRGGLPPPPPDAKEDPRAAAGRRVSYHDMDLVAEGDVELTY